MRPTPRGADSGVLPRPQDKRDVVEHMFDRIAGDYERVNRVISLGLDRRWRNRAVDGLGLPSTSLVLDLACGTGDLSRILRRRGYLAVGYDFSANMLRHATGPHFLVRADVVVLPVADAGADGIVCGFALRNLVDIGAFLAECVRVLRPGGRVALLDAATPENAVVRVGHRLWFGHVVPWLGARMSEAAPYRYLSASTVYLPSGAELRAQAEAAGFTDVAVDDLTFGAVRLLTATRP
ncbi:MAG TPA: ubiquinone/menaquinone biosynthesis methyltransferase [Acidimicrobiales bacterium]|nr:ubiquinone/menaquinone biosynthesis methyltransferase [Acidimicrobiales bacterium]